MFFKVFLKAKHANESKADFLKEKYLLFNLKKNLSQLNSLKTSVFIAFYKSFHTFKRKETLETL